MWVGEGKQHCNFQEKVKTEITKGKFRGGKSLVKTYQVLFFTDINKHYLEALLELARQRSILDLSHPRIV